MCESVMKVRLKQATGAVSFNKRRETPPFFVAILLGPKNGEKMAIQHMFDIFGGYGGDENNAKLCLKYPSGFLLKRPNLQLYLMLLLPTSNECKNLIQPPTISIDIPCILTTLRGLILMLVHLPHCLVDKVDYLVYYQ
jgi:hypothetical protein